MTKKTFPIMLCMLCVFGLFAFSQPNSINKAKSFAASLENLWQEDQDFEISDGMEIPLADAPISTVLMPEASGKIVYSNQNAAIDASNSEQGYIMVKYTGSSTAKKKVIVTGPSKVRYTYDLNSNGQYEVFPMSDGSGGYTVGIYQNISGTKYGTVYTASMNIALQDEFAPFLLPNQYVNYNENSKATLKAAELTKDQPTILNKIDVIYKYVINNVAYDRQEAATVQSGYLPNVDEVLTTGKGICFDYAALMTAMLRSQGVPTKLVVGYSGTAYHAWINTWTKESGWLEGVIFFDGTTWKLMDPTYASSGKSGEAIMKYIGDGTNYSAKYLY
ncbi:MAG: transglutaminase-like domain-containing protein [Clostridiaceae bacterium]|nr:transglutaminase-like domain-containing protein [Clostridiaceae bacterium]